MWKTINEISRKTDRNTAVSLIEHEGKQLTDKEKIASAFNKHFVNVGRFLAEKTEVKSTDDSTQFLTAIDKSVIFKFKALGKH